MAQITPRRASTVLWGALVLTACGSPEGPDTAIAERRAAAKAVTGEYIHWEEHIIDDQTAAGGVPLRGADGLAMADLDRDGYEDIVSAHEDSSHIRVAFGSEDPFKWFRLSLAEGPEAGGVEDIAIGDLNQDGFPDIVAACEKAHLLYLQNPGGKVRGFRWERLIPPLTRGRGSWIRVAAADLDGDGRMEVIAANKGFGGGSNADGLEPSAISWFEIAGDPLDPASWVEHELTRVKTPINAQPVDLDGDGDLDIFAGSRGESRVFWFENLGGAPLQFAEHEVRIEPLAGQEPQTTGFHLEFHDFNGDGRLDVLLRCNENLVWIEQPAAPSAPWKQHLIGTFHPDNLVGFVIAGINGDEQPDIMAGAYSSGPRNGDGVEVTRNSPVGRLGWFEHPGHPAGQWLRHDFSRRKRGMYDSFAARDLDGDGDLDFIATRGNSGKYDGVFWLEQVRDTVALKVFTQARETDSQQLPPPEQ